MLTLICPAGVLDVPLSQPLSDALYETKKITQLFSHQAEAVNHLAAGHSVIVSTSTSSGKSLIYQIPVLSALEADPSSTALYIFPTKALAQDQKRALAELLRAHIQLDWVKVSSLYFRNHVAWWRGAGGLIMSIQIATFDGDTPQQDRDYIRENANVIFTNPDMLHMAILPREESWRRFFRNLKLIVVDGTFVRLCQTMTKADLSDLYRTAYVQWTFWMSRSIYYAKVRRLLTTSCEICLTRVVLSSDLKLIQGSSVYAQP